jgi:hypothetical protein
MHEILRLGEPMGISVYGTYQNDTPKVKQNFFDRVAALVI